MQKVSVQSGKFEELHLDHSVDEVNLSWLISEVWKGRWVIVIFTIFSAAAGVAISLLLPNEYKATAILTPASASSASSLSRLANQFGGLAALAGINLESGSDSSQKTIIAMELIKTWGFQESFIRDNDLAAAVFASKGWNRSSNQLIFDEDIFSPKEHKWVRRFKPENGETATPGSWELYEKLSKRVSITQDKKTNLISLSVEFYSPYLAKEWVDKLVVAVNKQIQESDRADAKKSIAYLEGKMKETDLTEMKLVFSRLIEEQTKTLMLTDVSDEYVLKTLSPAKVPEKKSKPSRALICISMTAMGFMLSVFLWLVRGALAKRASALAFSDARDE